MSLLKSTDLSLWFSTPKDFTESLDAIAKVEKLLSCNTCTKVMERPVTLWSCDHIFCQDCVENMDKCAVCSLPSWPEDQRENKTMTDISRLCSSIKGILSDYMQNCKSLPKLARTPEDKSDTMSENTGFSMKNTTFATQSVDSLKPPDAVEKSTSISGCDHAAEASRTATADTSLPTENSPPVLEDAGASCKPTIISETAVSSEAVPNAASKDENTILCLVNNTKTTQHKTLSSTTNKSKRPARRLSKVKYAPTLPFPDVTEDSEGSTIGQGTIEGTEDENGKTESFATPDKAKRGRQATVKKATDTEKKKADFATPPSKRKRYSTGYATPKTSLKRLSSPGGCQTAFRTPKTPGSAKKNRKGETPLHIAAMKGKLADVQKLIEDDIDVNSKDNAGWTPLHEACNHGHTEVVRSLLDAGASVNIPGYDNETPIVDALSNDHFEIVQLLLERGANPHLRNINGKSAMSYAETDEMKSMLTKFTKPDEANVNLLRSDSKEDASLDSAPQEIVISFSSAVSKSSVKICSKILNARMDAETAVHATHLVVGSCKDGKCSRTLKYLQAIANGAWIVQRDWLEACIVSGGWVNEHSFEIISSKEDILNDGPKRSRKNKVSQCPGILSGYHFYLSGSFQPPSLSKELLAEIIKLADGVMLTREPKPDSDSVQTSTRTPYHAQSDTSQYFYTHYIVYDSTQAKPSRIIRQGKVCSIPSSWLLDCISQFHLCEIPE